MRSGVRLRDRRESRGLGDRGLSALPLGCLLGQALEEVCGMPCDKVAEGSGRAMVETHQETSFCMDRAG